MVDVVYLPVKICYPHGPGSTSLPPKRNLHLWPSSVLYSRLKMPHSQSSCNVSCCLPITGGAMTVNTGGAETLFYDFGLKNKAAGFVLGLLSCASDNFASRFVVKRTWL
jgi:hypothetical protein